MRIEMPFVGTRTCHSVGGSGPLRPAMVVVPTAQPSSFQAMPSRILRPLSRLCAQIKAQLREEQTTPCHCGLSTFDRRYYANTFAAAVKKPCVDILGS